MKTLLKRKLREWLRRYLPAEITGTITALFGATLGHALSGGSLVVAAYAGTIGENIGYYGYFAVKESMRHYRAHAHHATARRIMVSGLKTVRDMMVEFGPAELLDSFIVRPLLMYLGPQLVGHFQVGIFAGKVAADVIFYSLAIIGYEIRKRWQ